MANKVKLTDKQIEDINGIKGRYKDYESVLRKCDIVLMYNNGVSAINISRAIGCTRSYVYYMKDLFLRYGMRVLYSTNCLLSGPEGNSSEKRFSVHDLDEDTVMQLKELYDDPNTSVGVRKRIYVILSTDAGISNDEIAAKINTGEEFVKEVQEKFELVGVDFIMSKAWSKYMKKR